MFIHLMFWFLVSLHFGLKMYSERIPCGFSRGASMLPIAVNLAHLSVGMLKPSRSEVEEGLSRP